MTFRRTHFKFLALAASCVALGAAISAIATAGAATAAHPAHPGAHARLGGRPILRRAVHGDLVVKTANGFATVSFDRGTVESVSGQTLVLREGTPTATYKTVTLTIPADATVRVNRAKAALSDVTTGQRAAVIVLPKRTLVIARTARTP
jgi:hypothetical protein